MKRGFGKWLLRSLLGFIGLGILVVSGFALTMALAPEMILIRLINYQAPQAHFSAQSVEWESSRSFFMKDVQVAPTLRVSRIYFSWKWKDLFHRHFGELRLDHPTLSINLQEIAQLKPADPSSTLQKSSGKPWYLDKLTFERGELVVEGLAPTLPAVTLEIEGSLKDVPLGTNLSQADLQKSHTISLRNFSVHSPIDPTLAMLTIESIVLEFHFGGLNSHELDSLTFDRPIFNIDRSFFWFVEQLRANTALYSSHVSREPEWTVHSLEIQRGGLDISRLQEFSLEYPFEFELSQKDLKLKNLSLAELPLEFNIHSQNIEWEKAGMYFGNLRGKIAFHKGATKMDFQLGQKPPNDLVNTLYSDLIRWREFEITSPWLFLTFDAKAISGSFGGSFAKGYINGGMSAGWSGKEPWRVWGSAANVDAGEISDLASNQSFSMNGQADLSFDVEGKVAELHGNLKLNSLSKGTLHFHSLNGILERIEKNTIGMKRELLEAFVSSLKEYPYDHYILDVQYVKPNANVKFRSESPLGSRKLDLDWHGGDNQITDETKP